jgi:uncharacterized protein YdeI (YjbR/CyaY-like superfamily)
MNLMNPKVDWFFAKDTPWQEEYIALRMLILGCGLTEELKWGCPCYTFQKSNIVLIHGFKDYCAMLFFKGALLQDADNILVQQTENTQATRQIRFTNLREIADIKTTLNAYIYEAIAVEEAGLTVDFKKPFERILPEELQNKFDENPALKTAFEALTPGRKNGYILYFSAPKQTKTRQSRIEKYTQQILIGKGLNDT